MSCPRPIITLRIPSFLCQEVPHLCSLAASNLSCPSPLPCPSPKQPGSLAGSVYPGGRPGEALILFTVETARLGQSPGPPTAQTLCFMGRLGQHHLWGQKSPTEAVSPLSCQEECTGSSGAHAGGLTDPEVVVSFHLHTSRYLPWPTPAQQPSGTHSAYSTAALRA